MVLVTVYSSFFITTWAKNSSTSISFSFCYTFPFLKYRENLVASAWSLYIKEGLWKRSWKRGFYYGFIAIQNVVRVDKGCQILLET